MVKLFVLVGGLIAVVQSKDYNTVWLLLLDATNGAVTASDGKPMAKHLPIALFSPVGANPTELAQWIFEGEDITFVQQDTNKSDRFDNDQIVFLRNLLGSPDLAAVSPECTGPLAQSANCVDENGKRMLIGRIMLSGKTTLKAIDIGPDGEPVVQDPTWYGFRTLDSRKRGSWNGTIKGTMLLEVDLPNGLEELDLQPSNLAQPIHLERSHPDECHGFDQAVQACFVLRVFNFAPPSAPDPSGMSIDRDFEMFYHLLKTRKQTELLPYSKASMVDRQKGGGGGGNPPGARCFGLVAEAAQ
jgi:hypothetical protein